MKDLKTLLNPSQLQAVSSLHGPFLVIAGAGSGKTRVIEYRVLNLVQNDIPPESVLLLTFTRKAAREMLSRASRHNPGCMNVEGGTFHSFAYKLLKKYSRVIGLPASFAVLDESDSEEAIQRCAAKMGLYEKERRFPKKNTVRAIISMSVNKNTPVREVVEKEYPHFVNDIPEIEGLRKEYVAYKINQNYLDYDDLLLFLQVLLEDGSVRDRLAEKYKYVMVDEYQDTNVLQGTITFLLAERHRNIMVVGDDAQSIYGFRGASHENIMKFPEMFPGCTIIKLEENYRSTQRILDIANAVMENMKNKYTKCLTSAKNIAGQKPRLVFFKDIYDEAEWVADSIRREADEGVPLSRQCVLFRSLYLSIPIQSELSRRNIPYETYGGLKFYETAHVRDIIAHLKVASNTRDELAWNRILMLIQRIGPKTASRITDKCISSASLHEVVAHVLRNADRSYNYSERLSKLGAVLETIGSGETPVGEKFDTAFRYYTPILKEKYDDWHMRINDLETLKQISSRYGSLNDLLADFALEPPERGVMRVEPETREEEKPLVLSTIHSAKGLEWDTVYILNLSEGVLPISFALDSEEEIEEEHRLFYVAVTRARSNLLLTMHHEGTRGGITQFNRLSRFIDVPDVLDKLDMERSPGPDADDTFAAFPSRHDKKALFERISRFHR